MDFLSSHLIMNAPLSVDTFQSSLRDHPFKTSACSRGGGVKNLPNLPTDSTKKSADGRGVGVKNRENLPTS